MHFALCSLLLLPAQALEPTSTGKPAHYPAWWFERGVIRQSTTPAKTDPAYPGDYPAPDEYAALNQGQLKHLATAARDELLQYLRLSDNTAAVDAATAFSSLVDTWFEPGSNSLLTPKTAPPVDTYAAVNLGQLKTIARSLHQSLVALDYEDALPWAIAPPRPPDDHAIANLGQAKNLFSFDLTADSDGDSIEDWKERRFYHTDLTLIDSDGDGLSDAMEIQLGLDPNSPIATASSVQIVIFGLTQ